MLVDLRYFEFARMVDMLPFSVGEKKKILPCALGSAPESDPNMISERVFDYLCDNSLLNLNGFCGSGFRMLSKAGRFPLILPPKNSC